MGDLRGREKQAGATIRVFRNDVGSDPRRQDGVGKTPGRLTSLMALVGPRLANPHVRPLSARPPLKERRLATFTVNDPSHRLGVGNRRAISRRFLLVVESVILMCPIDRSADQLNGCSYLLLGRQPMPRRNGFLQCGAISLSASSVVEGRGLPGVNIDFVVIAHRQRQRPGLRLRGRHLLFRSPVIHHNRH